MMSLSSCNSSIWVTQSMVAVCSASCVCTYRRFGLTEVWLLTRFKNWQLWFIRPMNKFKKTSTHLSTLTYNHCQKTQAKQKIHCDVLVDADGNLWMEAAFVTTVFRPTNLIHSDRRFSFYVSRIWVGARNVDLKTKQNFKTRGLDYHIQAHDSSS